MDIGALRSFDRNGDKRISKAELERGLGPAARDHRLDSGEIAALKLDPADATQINKALKHSAKGKAETTVFLLDGTQPVRVQSIGGAIFNKTESNALSEYRGITAEVRLPQVSFDPQRYFSGREDTPLYKVGPLDRPSVYMGGVVDLGQGQSRIMDVGLCWDRVYSPEGLETLTDRVPKGQQHGCDGNDPAHRFFADAQAQAYQLDGKTYYLLHARETAGQASSSRSLLVDAAGQRHQGSDAQALMARFKGQKPVLTPVILDGNYQPVCTDKKAFGQKISSLKPNFAFRPYWRTTHEGDNQWHNPELKGGKNLYFYPGEQLRMTVKEQGRGDDNIELRIERTKGPSFQTRFSQDGFGQGKPQAFKYVHSIDQFREVGGVRLSTENMNKIDTLSSLHGVSWKPFLIDSKGGHVQMNADNSLPVGAADTSSSLAQRRAIFKRDAAGEHIQPTKSPKP